MRKLAIALLVLVLFSSQVFGLSWSQVMSLASSQSNDIKSAEKQLSAYQWFYYKSYSNFLPQISASLSDKDTTASGANSKNYSYGVSLSQNIFSGLDNYYNTKSTWLNYDYYQANLKSVQADYFNRVRTAFIDLLTAQKNLEVQKQIKKSRETNARMINLLYGSGREDKGNYLRTEALLDNANYSINKAMRDLELARLKLSQLIDSKIENAEGSPEVSNPTQDPDVEKLLKTAPSFIMAKDQLELAEVNQQATIKEFLPTVSLSGSWQRSGSDWPPSASSKSLSLSVSLPIFPGGSNIADRVIYGYLLDKAREDFAKSRKDIYYNISKAFQDFVDASQAYEVQKKFLVASEERAKIAQAKYWNGLASYFEWDQIQNEYINNQSSILNYRKAVFNAEANWHKSYGGWVK